MAKPDSNGMGSKHSACAPEAIRAEGSRVNRDEKLRVLDVALARGMSDADAERVMPLKDAFRHIRETLGAEKS